MTTNGTASSSSSSACLLATGGYDHTIKLWDVLTGTCAQTLSHQGASSSSPSSQVNALALSSGRRFLAAARNPGIKIYDLKSGNPNPVLVLDGHTGNVTCVGFEASPEARWLYSASEDGSLRIWDMRVSGCQRVFEPKFVPAAGSAGTSSAQMLMGSAAAAPPINAAALHPNHAEIITGDQNGSVCVWDLVSSASSNIPTATYTPEQDVSIRSISVTRDASRVAVVTSKGLLHAWNSKTRFTFGMTPLGGDSELSPVHEQLHDTYILKCCFSPNMKLLATASADRTIKIWNAADFKKPVKIFTRHQRWVWDCAFSSDSCYLVSASSDHSARLWSVGSGDPATMTSGGNNNGDMVRIFSGHSRAVTSVALSDEPE